ncbi:hypothetical protein BDQ17DRAFT_454015 [Cyathus striatus]|nr:hypothetical protein BDQ17DRAFT_454015 [Cyathus striatus]
MFIGIASYEIVSAIAIGLSLCDVKWKFGEELKFLWMTWKPWRWSFEQFLYASCRCLPPLVWIFNIVMANITFQQQLSLKECRNMIIYHTVISYYLLGVIDLILWRRVYAIFRESMSIRLFLLSLIAIKLGQSVAFIFVSLPQIRFNNACVAMNIHPLMLCSYASLGIVLHSFLTVLVFMKKERYRRRLRPVDWFRVAPLFDTMIRHGLIMVTFMSSYAAMIICATFRAQEMGPAALSVFPVFVAGVSFLGCHLMLSFNRAYVAFGRLHNTVQLTEVEYTSWTHVTMELDTWFTRTIPAPIPEPSPPPSPTTPIPSLPESSSLSPVPSSPSSCPNSSENTVPRKEK